MSSKIRMLHGCPALPTLDAYCSQQKMCQNVGFNHVSDYLDIDYGSYNISVCTPDRSNQPLVNAYAYLADGNAHTAVLSGSRDNPNVFIVPDGFTMTKDNQAYLRFVNLAYDAPCLDFRFTDGAFVIANDIRYKEVTRYYPVTPSTYQMQATICNSSFVVLRIPQVTLQAGRSYTLYITGSARVQPYCSHILAPDNCCWPTQPIPPRPPIWQPVAPTVPSPPAWQPCSTPVITTWDCGCAPTACPPPCPYPPPCSSCPPPCPPTPPCWDTGCSCTNYYPDSCGSYWDCGCDSYTSSGWSSDGICYDSGFTHYYHDHC